MPGGIPPRETPPGDPASVPSDVALDQHVGLSGRLIGGLALIVVLSIAVAWWQQTWLVLILGAGAAVVAAFTRAHVRIDRSGFRVRVGRTTLVDEPLERLRDAEVVRVRPYADFRGWGWRIAPDGRRGFIAGSGEALQVNRVDDPPVVITMPQADRAAGVLNALLARERPGPAAA